MDNEESTERQTLTPPTGGQGGYTIFGTTLLNAATTSRSSTSSFTTMKMVSSPAIVPNI